ncbi:MAG: hypothetical protein EZS28_029773, partial [Streblomastix strix]
MFAQIKLPDPGAHFKDEEIELIRNLAKSTIQGLLHVFLDGPLTGHTLEELSVILSEIYIAAFCAERRTDIFVSLSNTIHPLLRIPTIRE